ncbi:MAG: nuclear transport factor 2 family protein [Cyanothece sp. SIO1E1]|nr:nuclear transport factor 2 family protein [Cyanothece sp. SIO1E1]
MINKTTYLPKDIVRPEEAEKPTVEDRLEIQELLARIYLAEDSRDTDALRQCVSPDINHNHSLYGEVNGIENFVDWVVSNPQFFDGLRHQVSNTATSSIAEKSARAVSYIQVLQVHSDDQDVRAKLPRIIAQGVVRDVVVKLNGRWVIQKRTYDQLSILPELIGDAEVLNSASKSINT